MIKCHLCLEVRAPAFQSDATQGFLCPGHLFQLRAVLVDLDHWFHLASSAEHLATTRDQDAERWVGSKAPCDTVVLSVLDPRSRALVPGDPVSPERVLRAWAYAIHDNQDTTDPIAPSRNFWAHDLPMPRVSVTALVAIHLGFLDWTVAQPSVVRYARHMAAARRAAKRLVPPSS